MDRFYKPEPDGLIGNEDCGQMSAWYVLSAAGFYPVSPGTDVYCIGSPLFAELRFNLENGRSFRIKANNVSTRNIYIQSAKLNGRQYQRSFLTHRMLMAGGELVFEMGPEPNHEWGTGAGNIPVSSIADLKIVPVPVIKSLGKTFKDRNKISFETKGSDVTVRYTTDGSEPGRGSTLFKDGFVIDASTVVRARAFNNGGESSLIATATFHKIPHSWNIELKARYSQQYPAGGDLALIDGLRGTTNFSGGAWQGYQGQDLVAVVDLGKVQQVSRLGAGFLQDVRSWILMPRQIDFDLSSDGREFVNVLSIPVDVSDKLSEVLIKDFIGKIAPQPARFVRIRARSYGKLPAWHPGSGGDSWIFVDEILIE